MYKIGFALYQHMEWTKDGVGIGVDFNEEGDVVVKLGEVITFMTLLHFNQLRAALNKFDVTGE